MISGIVTAISSTALAFEVGGTVLAVPVNLGDTVEVEPTMKVAPGRSVFQMDSEAEGLRVEVQMPETRIAKVRQGDAVEVAFAPTRELGFVSRDCLEMRQGLIHPSRLLRMARFPTQGQQLC